MENSNIQIGKFYKFNYPKEFVTLPDYTEQIGKTVQVIRKLDESECDAESAMYVVSNGEWIGHAFDDELEPI